MLFLALDPADLVNRVIIVDSNVTDFNLREVHDSIFPQPLGNEAPPITVTCIIQQGVIVGSSSTASRAFKLGDWPAGIAVTVWLLGRIQGRGGNGPRPTPAGCSLLALPADRRCMPATPSR